MTNNINPNQINAMAKEIANLLDQNEKNKATQNDGHIEASIWNKFVGDGEDPKNQIGNGQKSLIRHKIGFDNAISSIAYYIRKNGTDAIANALNRVGIEWKPSTDVKAGENKNEENSNNNIINVGIADIDLDIAIKDKAKVEKIIKARQEKMKKAEKVFNETFQIANTEKASNGMTYVEARSIYNRIRRQWSEGMHDMHSLTDEQIINLIKKYIDNPPYGMTSNTVKYYRDMLNAFTTSIDAKSELEQNFENLAKIDDLYLQSKGRDIWVLKEDADYIKTFRLWG